MADLSVRAPLDAEGLVDALFKRVDFRKAGFDNVVVLPRAVADTDSYAFDHDVVIWHCGAPFPPDWNVKAWVWRFALSTVTLTSVPACVRFCMRRFHVGLMASLPSLAAWVRFLTIQRSSRSPLAMW